MNEFGTATTLARLLGISTRSVSNLAKDGLAVRAKSGRYDIGESVRRYCAHLRELSQGHGGAEVAAAAAGERARLSKERADSLALKNMAMRGELVSAGDVEATWAAILSGVRAGILACPSRVSQRLPHLTRSDTAEIDAELRQVLSELGGAG